MHLLKETGWQTSNLKSYRVLVILKYFSQFFRSQLLNLAHTLRVTKVKLIIKCLWNDERLVLFQLFLIYF